MRASGKKIVLLGVPGESTNIVYNRITETVPIEHVILENHVPRKDLLRRRLRKLGLVRVIGQVAFHLTVVPLLKRASRERRAQIEATFGLEARSIPDSVICRVESVNSEQAITLLKQIQPDIIVINGTRIISMQVLTSVAASFINIHAGITPLFRGVHGAYWALVMNQPDACGVTVHVVDAGIDTGGILAQALIQPTPDDNFVTYPFLQLGAGLPLLQSMVGRALHGILEMQPPPPGASTLWTHPTLWDYLWNRLTNGVR